MNIHTKREKEFVGEFLKLLKQKGALLLKRSEIPEFVESHRPPKVGEFTGHRLGRLNTDMRLLCAIAHYFDKKFKLAGEEWNATVGWHETVRGMTSYEIASLCNDAIWFFIKERFGRKVDKCQGYLLQPDWSIHAVDRITDLPWPPDLPEQLLSRLEGQLIAHSISTF